jgi:hypothetical protein
MEIGFGERSGRRERHCAGRCFVAQEHASDWALIHVSRQMGKPMTTLAMHTLREPTAGVLISLSLGVAALGVGRELRPGQRRKIPLEVLSPAQRASQEGCNDQPYSQPSAVWPCVESQHTPSRFTEFGELDQEQSLPTMVAICLTQINPAAAGRFNCRQEIALVQRCKGRGHYKRHGTRDSGCPA